MKILCDVFRHDAIVTIGMDGQPQVALMGLCRLNLLIVWTETNIRIVLQ